MYVPDSYRTSVLFATLSTYFSLVSSFCSSDQIFAADFFQIPPRDGHPCLSGYTIPTIRARWGLAPVRHYSCRAYKKPLTSWKPTVVLFCTVRPGLLSNCVSSNCVSSNCINSNCINCILSRSLLCLVTTRSERDSCNSYEHKYQFLHFLKLLKSVKQSIVTKTMQRYTLFQHPPSFFMIFFTLIL